MNIYPIQQSIVAKLQADIDSAGLPFLSTDLPETDDEYNKGVKAPIAYVIYSGSSGSPSVSTNVIAQPRKLSFDIECRGKTLYRENGLYVLCDVVEQSLLGFKPLNCKRLTLVRDDIGRPKEGSAIWVHLYQFECETMLIQKEDSDPIIIPSFEELVIDN